VVDGVLRCRVTAPPVDGAANEALCRLLSDDLGVPRSAVDVVGGTTARVKRVVIMGRSEAAIRARWPGLRV
jgi:uncharacterized protein YggU (UPF0235/DUF167 family)